MPETEGFSMEAVRLAVIEGQLTHIATSLESLIAKQDAMAQPLQDQAMRITKVEGRIEDCFGQSNNAVRTADSAHRRLDRVDTKNAYIAGAVAGVLACSAFIAWSLKDTLDAARTLPVVQERQKLQMEQLGQSTEEVKKLLEKHLDKMKGD